MPNVDPFSMSTMFNSLQHIRLTSAPQPMNPAVPPPPPPRDDGQRLLNSFTGGLFTPRDLELRLQATFNLMTNDEEEDGTAPFKEIISMLDRRELKDMASLLTTDSDYFLDIARTKNGSKRLQELIGKSDDVDYLFLAVILRRFLHVMTDKNAAHVAIRGIRVFDEEKNKVMYELIRRHALQLARDKHGCIALNVIITGLGDAFYRDQLFDVLASNALYLSYDACGNFVVQRVLKLKDLRCTYNIAVRLVGHCVELAFNKHGSYIVEKLLETDQWRLMVVSELLMCEGYMLLRLARSDYGNYVVGKALRVTKKEIKIRPDRFWGLVNKLMPFRHLLRGSPGSIVAAILDSVW